MPLRPLSPAPTPLFQHTPHTALLQVPITPDLVYSFGPQAHHTYSSLAGSFYAPVVNWVFSTPGEPYYAWDALTAACMMDPPLCKASPTHGFCSICGTLVSCVSAEPCVRPLHVEIQESPTC
jgi:hypothetical protein